jgi:hypothetical protein
LAASRLAASERSGIEGGPSFGLSEPPKSASGHLRDGHHLVMPPVGLFALNPETDSGDFPDIAEAPTREDKRLAAQLCPRDDRPLLLSRPVNRCLITRALRR